MKTVACHLAVALALGKIKREQVEMKIVHHPFSVIIKHRLLPSLIMYHKSGALCLLYSSLDTSQKCEAPIAQARRHN